MKLQVYVEWVSKINSPVGVQILLLANKWIIRNLVYVPKISTRPGSNHAEHCIQIVLSSLEAPNYEGSLLPMISEHNAARTVCRSQKEPDTCGQGFVGVVGGGGEGAVCRVHIKAIK